MMSYNPQIPVVNPHVPLTAPQLAGVEVGVAGQVIGSTPWSHVACAEGWKIPDPVMGYYTCLPPHAACKWSTNYGQSEKRTVSHPLPSRRLSHWNDLKLREQAAYYRQKFPQDMPGLTKPMRFEDLYDFFDGKDLYFQGAWNLWNLVYMLVDENIYLEPTVLDAQRAETDSWVTAWGNRSANRQRLLRWNRAIDILTVLSPDDWDRNHGGVVDLDENQRGMLRVSLVNFYRVLISPRYSGSPPFHAQRESQDGHPVAIWLDKTQSPPERITPPLSSISEEVGFQVPTGRAEVIGRARTYPRVPVIVNGSKGIPPNPRRSLDASPLANKGKHDGSDTSTMRAVSGTSSTKGGSPDSVETWKSGAFFKPVKPAKGQVATKTHQVTQSVPSVTTEPFPKLADSLPFPFNGVVEDESSKDQSFAGEKPFDEQTPRAVAGTQRPQTVAPIQQMSNVTGVEGFPPAQPMQQMPTPPVTQNNVFQGVNSYQASNNSGQLAQVSVTGGPMIPQTQSAHVYGFPPAVPREPLATNGSQQVQYQGAISYPGQPAQAHAPQAAPLMNPQQTTMPRHMVSMPMPSYGPNGFVQSQENQAQNRRYSNNRKSRNSPPRNGWQTKIRDDPIHGAVYVHNNLRKNTIVKGAGYQGVQPQQHQHQHQYQQSGGVQKQGPHTNCVNHDRIGIGRDMTYDPCGCYRCQGATRSVFLREFDQGVCPSNGTRDALKAFFSKWGEVENVNFRNQDTRNKQLHAFVRFKDDVQAFTAITSLQGQKFAIPGLGEKIFIGFPMYSKYFGRDFKNQEVRASVLGIGAAASITVPSDQLMQGLQHEMQSHRNGPVSDRMQHSITPYPGFGFPGGVPVRHGLPARPPTQQFPLSQVQELGDGYGRPAPGQILQRPQPSSFMPTHRPTPSSLQREVDALGHGREHYRSQLPSESGGSEPMDLASTSSSGPTSFVEGRSRADLPTTPPKQRDVSSSPITGRSQGSKTVRPEAHSTVPKQPVGPIPSSSSSSEGARPRVCVRLADSTSSSDDSEKSVAKPRPGNPVAKDIDPATVTLPPTPEDPLARKAPSLSPGDHIDGQENHLSDSKTLSKGIGLPSESTGADSTNNENQGPATDTEILPGNTGQPHDNKAKYKGNKAKKKPTTEHAQASAASNLKARTETQRPPSSASQGSSATDTQQMPKKKKKSDKKKRNQSAETTQDVDAAQDSSGNVADNEEEKTEEYKAKIKNLFSPPDQPTDAPSRKLPKEPEPFVENKRKGYRANAGGSLKMQRSRPPALSQNTFKSPDKSEASQLPTIVEAASKKAITLSPEISPTAHAFANQKFEIDQMKSKEQSTKQPKTEDLEPQPQSEARIGSFPPGFDPYPRPQSPRPSSRDDVFSPKKDEKKDEEWMHTESVRKTVNKDRSPVITPSPSPRKAVIASPSSTRSSLNPSAKPFVVPISRPLTPTAAMLAVGPKHGRHSSHISTHSSAPSTSSRNGRRFFTPLEQTPQRVSTPPSPRKAKQPQRRGPNGGANGGPDRGNQGSRNYNANHKKGGPHPQQTREQVKRKPVEPTAPKLNVDNFPELPAAKKPLVEAHAPKITFPSNTWRKSKDTASGRTSPKEQDKNSPNKNEE